MNVHAVGPMELYLVRHADALALGEPGAPTDAERGLSERGRESFTRVVASLEGMGIRLGRIETSPLMRAVQTGRMLHPLLDGETRLNDLLVSAPGSELIERLEGTSTALVGHEPWMSELLAILISGGRELASSLAFPKGGLAHLAGAPRPGAMRLLGYWRPEAFEAP